MPPHIACAHAGYLLNAAVVEALADPEVRKRLTDLGQEIPSREDQTPEALHAYQKAEIEKWWPIVKAAGINSPYVASFLYLKIEI